MDNNTLAAILAIAAMLCLCAYAIVALYQGIDSVLTTAVAGSFGAIIGAAATYLGTRGST